MYHQILDFWFKQINPATWWAKDFEFDQQVSDRFGAIQQKAVKCELFQWRENAQGRLAEIIVLDQFSRNIFRDSPMAYVNDPLALALAQEAISLGADKELDAKSRSFMYMPFMHSESPEIHQIAVQLFTSNGLQSSLKSELKHKKIIDKFGRYPHRNSILGRESSQQELAFLQQPGSSF